MSVQAKQAQSSSREWEATENASAKHEARGSEATENAIAKHEARGSEATKNGSLKPEGAKRPSRHIGLALFAFLCVSEHFGSIETHLFSKMFVSAKQRHQDVSAKR